MQIGKCKSLDDAVNTMISIRSYKPFKYSGTWYVAECNGEGIAYRKLNDLKKNLAKNGITELQIAVVK